MTQNSPKRKRDYDDDDYNYDERPRRRNRRGFLPGVRLLTTLGCLAIPLALFAIVTLTGLTSVDGILRTVRSIIDPGARTYDVTGGPVVLNSMVQLSELTTSQYNFDELVQVRLDVPYILAGLYRDSLIYHAVGTVEAGIDLSTMTESDIIVEGQTIIVRLPPPRLLRCFINEQQSSVMTRDTGWFMSPGQNNEQFARRFAIGNFRDAALMRGILEDANENAVVAIREFLEGLSLAGAPQFDVMTTGTVVTIIPPTCETAEPS